MSLCIDETIFKVGATSLQGVLEEPQKNDEKIIDTMEELFQMFFQIIHNNIPHDRQFKIFKNILVSYNIVVL